MIRHATARGTAWAALAIMLGLAVAGCAAGSGGRAYYPASGGYYSPYGNATTQSSTCGALGTCAPSNYPRIVPGDEHGD
jgi:hypothetical protein